MGPAETGTADIRYLGQTPMLDYQHPALARLIEAKRWRDLPEHQRIGAIYDLARDEIPFGYNARDDLPASAVLADGYGQCNTKTTLLMALLRGAGIQCRFHAATIRKRLQKGVLSGVFYQLAPGSIIHTWAEVLSSGAWAGLEGVILDCAYLDGLREHVQDSSGPFLGYAVGTSNLADPPVRWNGTPTSIQATGINQDLGIFDDPDTFYRHHGASLTGPRAWLFRHLARPAMNRKVTAIRQCAAPQRTAEEGQPQPGGRG